MSSQQNNIGRIALSALGLAALAGALFLAYAFYYDKDRFNAVIAEIPFSDRITAWPPIAKYFPEKAEAAKKTEDHDKHGMGGKSVNDILGGPEFTDGGKAPIQLAALQGGAPEPIVKASLNAAPPKSAADAAPPPSPSLSAPPQKFPSFPKTNAPTLNLIVETPQSAKRPPVSAKPEPAKAKAAPQAAAAPPPPPPPPKPSMTMLLPNVKGRLSDRADINVSMSVEMAYEANNALREELEFKRDMLSTLAGSVLRRHEYGTVNAAVLKTDILAEFNGQLRSGKLSAVEIKDLQIGQVASK